MSVDSYAIHAFCISAIATGKRLKLQGFNDCREIWEARLACFLWFVHNKRNCGVGNEVILAFGFASANMQVWIEIYLEVLSY